MGKTGTAVNKIGKFTDEVVPNNRLTTASPNLSKQENMNKAIPFEKFG